jgi:hypothetical protein
MDRFETNRAWASTLIERRYSAALGMTRALLFAYRVFSLAPAPVNS